MMSKTCTELSSTVIDRGRRSSAQLREQEAGELLHGERPVDLGRLVEVGAPTLEGRQVDDEREAEVLPDVRHRHHEEGPLLDLVEVGLSIPDPRQQVADQAEARVEDEAERHADGRPGDDEGCEHR